MKIAILGGTGRAGVHHVEYALEKGYVKVLARTPDKLDITSENLEIVQGNSINEEDVKAIILVTDLVLFALGISKGSDDNLMERSANNIVYAMKENGVSRIIYLTEVGVHHENKAGITDKIIKFLLKLFSGKSFGGYLKRSRPDYF